MELASLSAEPELVEVKLDSEQIVEQYGEPVVFWTWDRLPLETFMKLSDAEGNGSADMIDTVKPLMLDKEGNEILTGKKMLPTKVLAAAITAIVGMLGKL